MTLRAAECPCQLGVGGEGVVTCVPVNLVMAVLTASTSAELVKSVP